MDQVTLGGKPAHLNGDLPKAGDKAPQFRFVKKDMTEGALEDYKDKTVVIIAVPSLDTGVCATETRKFNEKLNGMDNVVGLVISKDLPFAMNRFCETEGIDNVISASDFRYQEFGKEYHCEMTDGAFQGILARVVFVLDKHHTITHVEKVAEVGEEPNYDAVLEAVKKVK